MVLVCSLDSVAESTRCVAHASAAAARGQEPLALGLLDIDNFKLTNDRHGHLHGDTVLRNVAAALRGGRAADRAYRIGGDEFALLMPGTDEQGARTVMGRLNRVLSAASAPASVGIAGFRSGMSADELRADADAALYEAKRVGGNRTVGFAEIRDRVSVATTRKREAVRAMIDEERLQTVFQPIWSFDSGRLLGVEALTRPDPTLGLSGPTETFDIAEQIGRVHELDVLCVRRALWTGSLRPQGALLFLNLAPKTLELDAGGDDWLLARAAEAGFAPDQIVVEVTERVGARTAAVIEAMGSLREQGFELALDDVGTGNAGLEMLRRIGADYVKIDQSIVAAAPTEPNARAVLMAMATFARQTGTFVIAEGIEDEETLSFLRGTEALDVPPGAIIQGGQGFRLGHPSAEMPPGTLEAIRSGGATNASPGDARPPARRMPG